jgi:hypothetical protein
MSTQEEITKKIAIQNLIKDNAEKLIIAYQNKDEKFVVKLQTQQQIKFNATTLINAFTLKLQKLSSQPAKPSTPKQPDPSVTADPSATGAPTTAQTESAKAEQIKATHLKLLRECGFITK